jgi:hypothetical protein
LLEPAISPEGTSVLVRNPGDASCPLPCHHRFVLETGQDITDIYRIQYTQYAKYVQYVKYAQDVSYCLEYRRTAKRHPSVSDVANANVSQAEHENCKARSRLGACHIRGISQTKEKICYLCKIS